MAISQERPRRKITGGRYKARRKKRGFHLGSQPAYTKIGSMIKRKVKILGGHVKMRLLAMDKVNLYNPETKKYEIVKITTVVDNPANRNFVEGIL